MVQTGNLRILIIDDNPEIHKDFINILTNSSDAKQTEQLEEFEKKIWGDKNAASAEEVALPAFQIDTASQGEEGVKKIVEAKETGLPYALAFVDVRMPPGWNGIETIKHIWEVDPNIQVVICTAFSDYTWKETVNQLGLNENLLVLKKPFDSITVCQLSCSLTKKWKMVEQMKREFISIVSHELRTPLTSVHGALELILDEQVDNFTDRSKKLLNIASQNSERLLVLINDLLDIEKFETGKMNFDLKIADLVSLVQNAVDANKIYGEKFGIQIHLTQLPADKVLVKVDADRLTQVLNNLLSNAIKFSTNNSPVTVTVTVNQNTAKVSVTNKGHGISKEFQSRIFQKFSQDNSADVRNKGGSGLGLSISKTFIEKMGGKLSFTSVPDHETTFYFELPISQE